MLSEQYLYCSNGGNVFGNVCLSFSLSVHLSVNAVGLSDYVTSASAYRRIITYLDEDVSVFTDFLTLILRGPKVLCARSTLILS